MTDCYTPRAGTVVGPDDTQQATSPFKGNGLGHGDFSRMVRKQVLSMKIGEEKQGDLLGRDKASFRTILKYVADKANMQFQTKSGPKGTIWIKRVF